MRRRQFVGALAVSLLAGLPAARAETAEARIIGQLSGEGYTQISVTRTFLGRIRITARGPLGTREIVLNPSNGAILRDYLDRGDSALRDEEDDVRTDEEPDEDDEDEDDDKEDDDKDDDKEDDDKDDDKDDGDDDD